MDRRSFLAATVAASALGFAAPASASEDAAAQLVRSVVDQVVGLIQSGAPRGQKVSQLRSIMESNVAMRDVAGFALGRYARGASAQQRDRYVDAYSGYVARTYVDRFSEYGGQQIEIVGVKDFGSKGYYVDSRTTYNGQFVNIGWQVRQDRSGQLKINDIVVDGLSMLESQRSEFTQMLAGMGGNVDAFIDRLNTLGA